jgi:hypothetical protein
MTCNALIGRKIEDVFRNLCWDQFSQVLEYILVKIQRSWIDYDKVRGLFRILDCELICRRFRV